MRVFVTGASGWIGTPVVTGLVVDGHEVVGLARSEASAAAIESLGATVERGTIDDLDTLRRAAEASDGVVHLAFNHEIAFSGDFAGAADADRAAVEVFGDALAGTDKPLVIASGVLGLAPGRIATERDGHDEETAARAGSFSTRLATAELTLALAERGIRSSIVRLAPTVHGEGDHGFMAAIVGRARETGVAGYVGDGLNRWPAAHRSDAATLFRLALEHAPAGSTLHGVGEEGVVMRDVAEAIGRQLDVPVQAVEPEHFAWLAGFIGLDAPASNGLTRELLGWEPTGPTLLEDLDAGAYTS